jgi:hypothetical protein
MHHHHRPQRSRQDSLHETARPHRLPRPSRILRTRFVGRGPSMRLDQIHRKNRIDIQRAEMRVGGRAKIVEQYHATKYYVIDVDVISNKALILID